MAGLERNRTLKYIELENNNLSEKDRKDILDFDLDFFHKRINIWLFNKINLLINFLKQLPFNAKTIII